LPYLQTGTRCLRKPPPFQREGAGLNRRVEATNERFRRRWLRNSLSVVRRDIDGAVMVQRQLHAIQPPYTPETGMRTFNVWDRATGGAYRWRLNLNCWDVPSQTATQTPRPAWTTIGGDVWGGSHLQGGSYLRGPSRRRPLPPRRLRNRTGDLPDYEFEISLTDTSGRSPPSRPGPRSRAMRPLPAPLGEAEEVGRCLMPMTPAGRLDRNLRRRLTRRTLCAT
jgi:hypothetical protein